MTLDKFLESTKNSYCSFDFVEGECCILEFEKNEDLDLNNIYIFPYFIFNRSGVLTHSVVGYLVNEHDNIVSIVDYDNPKEDNLEHIVQNLSIGNFLGFFKIMLNLYDDDDVNLVTMSNKEAIPILLRITFDELIEKLNKDKGPKYSVSYEED